MPGGAFLREKTHRIWHNKTQGGDAMKIAEVLARVDDEKLESV